jgi:hypothetical protein
MKRTGNVFFLSPVLIEQFDGFSGAFGKKPDAPFYEVFAEVGRNV